MQESRIKCGIPGGIKFSSQVGKVGSHHLRRDPTIPTWDPGWDCQDPAYIPPDILPGYAGCMSYELCNRPHSLWSLSGSVVEHWSAESEGLRFNSSWGLRILSSSHTCDETINIFLYIFPINKFDVNHVHVGSNAQSIMQVGQRSLGPLRSYATGIYIIVYWSYFTQYFRL